MRLWCCQCQSDVDARLTSGAEVYPHRPDLNDIPRWICDACKNHVGTHHKTDDPTKPLGNIPNTEIKNARILIHTLMDPYWKSGKVKRAKMYAYLSACLGYQYHTAEIKSIGEARKVYRIVRDLLSHVDAKGKGS